MPVSLPDRFALSSGIGLLKSMKIGDWSLTHLSSWKYMKVKGGQIDIFMFDKEPEAGWR